MNTFNTVPQGEIKPKKKNVILLSVAIVLAGILILGLFVFIQSSPAEEFAAPTNELQNDVPVPESMSMEEEFDDPKILGIFTAINFNAQEYYDTNGLSYKGFCSTMIDEGTVDELSSVTCFDTATTFAVSTKLSDENGHYCADSSGAQGVVEVGVRRGDTACASTQ